MANQKAHALLSDLYRILAIYDESDFSGALEIAPNLPQHFGGLLGKSSLSGTELPRALSVPLRNGHEIHIGSSAPQDVDAITTAIKRSEFFVSVGRMEAFGQRNGTRVTPQNKESRSRFARRLAQAIAKLPRSLRSAAIRELLNNSPSQTAGWVEVLREK
jgi:hypothetical protein